MVGTRESVYQLLHYITACILVVVLTMHLLERVPMVALKPNVWALWLLLICAGYHGLNGLRGIIGECGGRTAKAFAEVLFWILFVAVLVLGGAGLLKLM